jgi:hypothetical protein
MMVIGMGSSYKKGSSVLFDKRTTRIFVSFYSKFVDHCEKPFYMARDKFQCIASILGRPMSDPLKYQMAVFMLRRKFSVSSNCFNISLDSGRSSVCR